MSNIIEKIFEDKFAKIAFLTLLFLYTVILFANFIAPYSNTYSNRDMSYAPPSKIYTIDESGRLSWPYTYNYIREYEPSLMQTVYKQDRSKKYYIKLLTNGHLLSVENGGRLYLLGADINGRDVFSRLFFGGQISMTVGFLALLILFPIGLLYGGISGYFGGKLTWL